MKQSDGDNCVKRTGIPWPRKSLEGLFWFLDVPKLFLFGMLNLSYTNWKAVDEIKHLLMFEFLCAWKFHKVTFYHQKTQSNWHAPTMLLDYTVEKKLPMLLRFVAETEKHLNLFSFWVGFQILINSEKKSKTKCSAKFAVNLIHRFTMISKSKTIKHSKIMGPE